ncbi:MAG: thermonuclease [Deltaproteobacteria bacterium]|nr:thermonuclease [Deltaproteobacteria bacterium]
MIGAVLSALLAAASCGTGTPEERCGPASARVTRVIDGDTVELEDGTKVRYLLVDTPEITKGKDDCFGREAALANDDWVGGKVVDLTYDQECSDHFGRLLAWVWVNGKQVNRLLVEGGYACVLYIAPNGKDRKEEFEALEAQAKDEGRGMWGACQEVACDK